MNLIIQENALKKLPLELKKIGSTFTIITDSNLNSQAQEVAERLQKAKLVCHVLVVPAGEATKQFRYVEELIASLVKLKMRRESGIIAFGGGVVGDLAGFVASIYLRGVPFINIPTTVLAMADSSIGGKTGIDLEAGKNLVGTFYDATLTIMDPLLLKSLPEREYKMGFAEIIKHAIIRDKTFFKFLVRNSKLLLNRNAKLLTQTLKKSAAIKCAIIKNDKHESIAKAQTALGKTTSRMLVNYGHTVGHAIEKASEYSIPHGHAVAMGMVAENRLAIARGMMTEVEGEQIIDLLKAFGLPTSVPLKYSEAELKRHMLKDKKRVGNQILFALPKGIGRAQLVPYDYGS